MDYRFLLVAALMLVFYAPVFSALADTWSMDPYYSHGFLVPAISLYVAYSLRRALKADDRDFMYGAALTAAGLALYGYGMLNRALYLSALSFIIVVSGMALSFYSGKGLKRLAFPILFLIFMIPLPYTDYASTYLQSYTASAASVIIRAAGIPAENQGSQIVMGEDSGFVIGEPCSGLRTMLALFALAAIFAYYMDAPAWKKWLVFFSALPVAVLANVLRVDVILYIAHYWGHDLAMAFFHEASSLFLFLLAFILLIIISRLLGCKGVRNISRS